MNSHDTRTRTFLLDFFRVQFASVDATSNFVQKVEIMCNMFGVLVKHFDFLASPEWSPNGRFLEASYSKVLESRGFIYAKLDINRGLIETPVSDINNPVPRLPRRTEFFQIYDDCLNVFSEFEKKYLERYPNGSATEEEEEYSEEEFEENEQEEADESEETEEDPDEHS